MRRQVFASTVQVLVVHANVNPRAGGRTALAETRLDAAFLYETDRPQDHEQHDQPDKDACDLPAQPTPTARCVSLLGPPQRVQSQPPLLFWFQ